MAQLKNKGHWSQADVSLGPGSTIKLAIGSLASNLTSLSLNVLVCKVKIIYHTELLKNSE